MGRAPMCWLQVWFAKIAIHVAYSTVAEIISQGKITVIKTLFQSLVKIFNFARVLGAGVQHVIPCHALHCCRGY